MFFNNNLLPSPYSPESKKVMALIGESGTGKSFQAKFVAQKHKIDLIIDDGLLIKDNRILAGHSAKTESSFLTAVKVALFDDKSHRDEVARRLQNEKYKRILILGTSEKMVYKIAVRLQIALPKKFIKIEEVSAKEEIERAIRTRRIEGKHIIPVPSIEVKKNYPDIFFTAVRIFKKKRKITENVLPIVPTLHEKSVVRPEYSKRGRVIISEAALSLMVIQCADEYCVYAKYSKKITIKKVLVKDTDMGYRLVITIDVPYGIELGENIQEMQQFIIGNIEHYTGILIEEVNIIIDKITE